MLHAHGGGGGGHSDHLQVVAVAAGSRELLQVAAAVSAVGEGVASPNWLSVIRLGVVSGDCLQVVLAVSTVLFAGGASPSSMCTSKVVHIANVHKQRHN